MNLPIQETPVIVPRRCRRLRTIRDSRLALAIVLIAIAVGGLTTFRTMPRATADAVRPQTVDKIVRVSATDVNLTALNSTPDNSAAPDSNSQEPLALRTVELAAVDGQAVGVTQVAPAALAAEALFAAPAGPGFNFAPDLGGKILEERLPPPRRIDVPAVIYRDQPQPWQTPRYDPLPRELEPLAQTALRKDPLVLARIDSTALLFSVPDLPPVAVEVEPVAPTLILLNPAPRSYVPSRNATRVVPLAISDAPPREFVDPTDDPTRAYGEAALFRLRTALVAIPAAFLRLEIPDPFVGRRPVPLAQPMVDLDPPASPTLRPPLPPLVETKPDGKTGP